MFCHWFYNLLDVNKVYICHLNTFLLQFVFCIVIGFTECQQLFCYLKQVIFIDMDLFISSKLMPSFFRLQVCLCTVIAFTECEKLFSDYKVNSCIVVCHCLYHFPAELWEDYMQSYIFIFLFKVDAIIFLLQAFLCFVIDFTIYCYGFHVAFNFALPLALLNVTNYFSRTKLIHVLLFVLSEATYMQSYKFMLLFKVDAIIFLMQVFLCSVIGFTIYCYGFHVAFYFALSLFLVISMVLCKLSSYADFNYFFQTYNQPCQDHLFSLRIW